MKFLIGFLMGFVAYPLTIPWVFKIFPAVLEWIVPHYTRYIIWVNEVVNRLSS